MTKSTGQRKKRVTITPETEIELKALIVSGHKIATAAKLLKMSRYTAYKILKKFNPDSEFADAKLIERFKTDGEPLVLEKRAYLRKLFTRVAGSITEEKIKDTSFPQQITALEKVDKMEDRNFDQHQKILGKDVSKREIVLKIMHQMLEEEHKEPIDVTNS